jgi:hypothetical protein
MLVVRAREGHFADLSELPPNTLWRSKTIGAPIGGLGPLAESS